MFDIHCHILPQTDDGAKTWDIALEMCRIAAADGVEHIVATPHASEAYTYDREQHEATLAELRNRADGAVSFSLGCDFHFSFENIQDLLLHPERYTIGSTRYLLVELHDFSVAPSTGSTLSRLIANGLKPILTHPERNAMLQRQPELVLDWALNGCIVQVTANALLGRWGTRAMKTAEFLLRHDAVHILASDAHDTRSRPPVLSAARDAVATMFDTSLAQALVEANPRAVIHDEPLPWFPQPVMNR